MKNVKQFTTGFPVLILLASIFYFSSCKNTDVTAPTNPYGSGNGNVTFYKTNNVAGGVTIVINGESRVDNNTWTAPPGCDSITAAHYILPAGNYTASFTGSAVNCNKSFTITEGQCNLINYTSCGSPLPCPSNLDGTWTKIGDGNVPHSSGMTINVSGGIGTVTYVFAGSDAFCVGDIKWKNFNNLSCTMQDLIASTGCVEQNYTSGVITINAVNKITVAGQNYTKF